MRTIIQLGLMILMLATVVVNNAAIADELLNRPGNRVFAAGSRGEVVSVKAGTRIKKSNQVVLWKEFPWSR